jgi:LysM repeat protein
MKPWKRLIYYLFLNVLVSACTTLAVLVVWNYFHTPAEPATIESTAPVSLALNTAAPTGQSASSTAAASAVGTPNPTVRSSPIGNVEEYQVEYGDTLGIISERFDVPVEELMRINQISDANSLSVGMVLYIPVPPEAQPTQTPAPATNTPLPGSAIPTNPPQEARLIINAVIGPGDLASEHVFITRTGDDQLSLSGWQLKDEDGNVFVFPQLELYKDGAVNVWTTSGANTVVDLYWGLTSPVWSSEEKVTLLDAQGKVRATYTVP